MTILAAPVMVWLDASGVPERFDWDGTTYRVTDTPTRLDFDLNFVTHAPPTPTGWRFQGTNDDDDDDSLVFDVATFDHGQNWRVLHTYK